MEEKPNYYAIIPAEVRYNPELRASEKLLFGEITALSSATGICTASNNYFATLYGVVPSAITKWVSDLAKYEYIEIEYEKKGKEIVKRIIKLKGTHKYDNVFTKIVEGYSQKAIENNTSINNIKENNNINIITKEKFKKPTLEEIAEYCKERNNNVLPNKFYDFYESKGWMIGKNKMKDWKAAVRTWERIETKNKFVDDESDVPYWMRKDFKFEEEKDDEYEDFLKSIQRDSK